MAGQNIMSVTYGLDIASEDDPLLKAAEETVDSMLIATTPGTFFVDQIPILRYVPAWMPGAGFKRKAQEWRALAMRTVHQPFNAGKQQIVS